MSEVRYNSPLVEPAKQYGTPLTEAERQARHQALTGETVPPPRGTRKAKLSANSQTLFWLSIALNIGAVAVTLYTAWKEGWL